MVHRLPDVGLQRSHALASGQVAEIDRVRLVGGQAVVAAAGVGGGDPGPGFAQGSRGVGDRASAGGGVVELAQAVGDDRGLAAVGSDVGQAVAWSRAGRRPGLRPERQSHDQAGADRDPGDGQSSAIQEPGFHRAPPRPLMLPVECEQLSARVPRKLSQAGSAWRGATAGYFTPNGDPGRSPQPGTLMLLKRRIASVEGTK